MDINVARLLATLVVLGLVIFVHELGHFLVARWAGVRVDRFAIGFGPALFSIRHGETEYALCLIPLGGYVRMLGQTDTPEVEEQTDDERSYQNKSVGARMAIISAGVVMNILFGFACFAVAYQIGVDYQPAVIGTTIPALPAWKAGMKPGDRVIAIDGHSTVDYETLMSEVALTTPPTQTLTMTVERRGKTLDFEVAPVQERTKPVIGVLASLGLTLAPTRPTFPGAPAALASNPSFEGGDRVVSVDGEPVASHFELVERLYAAQDRAVTFGIERTRQDAPAPKRAEIKVGPHHVKTLGLEMQMGKLVALQAGSPAEKAVDEEGKPAPLQPEDVVKAVDGVVDFDPMRLGDILAAKAGKRVELTILRPGREQKEIKVFLTPERTPTWLDFPEQMAVLSSDRPMSAAAIGLAYKVLPTIRKIDPDGPAATADPPLEEGDVLRKIELHFEDEGKTREYSIDVKDDQWPSVFWALQVLDVKSVKLTVSRGGDAKPLETTLSPRPDTTWPFWPRGLVFEYQTDLRRATGVLDAIALGLERTRVSILRLYLFLRSLVMQYLSPEMLGGPLTIFRIAYSLAEDAAMLFLFMGMLNVNLAVINFLPIPIMDGGHMVFLTYELLTGRRPNERIVAIASWIGITFIISLMVMVIGLDVYRMVVSS